MVETIIGGGCSARYYTFMDMAIKEFHSMPTYDEKVGAHRMMALLSDFLWNWHFEEKRTLDIRTLIKTINDTHTNFLEDLVHFHPTH